MTKPKHLPECFNGRQRSGGLPCICDRLRACEQRVRADYWECPACGLQMHRSHMIFNGSDFMGEPEYVCPSCSREAQAVGYAAALNAAREAVAALEQYVNIPYESPSPAMNGEQGEWVWRSHVLAAIDALRGSGNPDTPPSAEKGEKP